VASGGSVHLKAGPRLSCAKKRKDREIVERRKGKYNLAPFLKALLSAAVIDATCWPFNLTHPSRRGRR